MKAASAYRLVIVTAPNLRVARRLAKVCVGSRLCACVNIVPRIESHYWWKGKIESGREVLLIIKTVKKHLGALEALVLAEHPYDTAEFIAVSLNAGSKRYLDWILTETGAGQ